MKIGDVIHYCITGPDYGIGIIVGFNKSGDGGKEFVHILCGDGQIRVYMAWDTEVLNESR